MCIDTDKFIQKEASKAQLGLKSEGFCLGVRGLNDERRSIQQIASEG